jgi:two-component system chemotaxis response regulator CheY
MNVNEMKILVCDDSIVSRKKLRDYILALGCTEVFEAANGEEAIELYNRENPTWFLWILLCQKWMASLQ